MAEFAVVLCRLCDSARSARFAELLEARGLEIRDEAGRRERSIGAGLVLFDRFDGEVCHTVRTMSPSGEYRVLAVACEPSLLENAAAWKLLEAGASDVTLWSDAGSAAAIAARLERWLSVERLLRSDDIRNTLAGRSAAWVSALRQLVEIARFSMANVLVVGDSGTGKELAARLIHALDPRPAKGEFVVLDCTTVVPELSGSEFFGHERGAFTGAVAERDGAFALADGGTLFLDELGELPLRMQAELLRVIQERTYKRVGSSTWRRADFRLVCATHRDLRREQAAGRFREDLYYRLAGCPLRLPALAERREDIPMLVDHFLRLALGCDEPPPLDPAVRDFFLARDYPGNVRDLQQLVLQVASRYVGAGPVTVGAIPPGERPPMGAPDSWPDLLFEQAIRGALLRGKGLDDIRGAAVETAYRLVLTDEQCATGRSAQRLKITKRAVQQYLHQRTVATMAAGRARECVAPPGSALTPAK